MIRGGETQQKRQGKRERKQMIPWEWRWVGGGETDNKREKEREKANDTLVGKGQDSNQKQMKMLRYQG